MESQTTEGLCERGVSSDVRRSRPSDKEKISRKIRQDELLEERKEDKEKRKRSVDFEIDCITAPETPREIYRERADVLRDDRKSRPSERLERGVPSDYQKRPPGDKGERGVPSDKEKINRKRRPDEKEMNSEPVDHKRQKVIRESVESTDLDLLKEYLQWDLISNRLYEWCAELMRVKGYRPRQELTNTVQRWLIHVNERYNDVPKYEWFCLLPAVAVDHSAWIFLRDALVEKRFVNDRSSADKTIDRLFAFIKDKHELVVQRYERKSTDRAPLHIEFDPVRQSVVVEKFLSKELPRLVPLIKKGGLLNTARLLLRYESFGNGSYQWGQHEDVHEIFYNSFEIRYEGFASPLNSRFIGCPGTRFCSLFLDTDREFGALGDFFQVDFEQHRGGWSLNPPFVNDVMLRVAETIVAVLDKGPHWWFFCLFPNWDDDAGWVMLNESKHLLRRLDMKPRSYAIQDAYGTEIWPTVTMNLFVLGKIPAKIGENKDIWASLENVLIRYRPGNRQGSFPHPR